MVRFRIKEGATDRNLLYRDDIREQTTLEYSQLLDINLADSKFLGIIFCHKRLNVTI